MKATYVADMINDELRIHPRTTNHHQTGVNNNAVHYNCEYIPLLPVLDMSRLHLRPG